MRGKQKDKAYAKAVYYYEEGEMGKSLLKCDQAIAANLKNSAAMNLKGLILYLQGDLQGARAQWKVNIEQNNDGLAKNYFEDSKYDQEKVGLYKEAEKLVRELKIDEALDLLNRCKESDFNCIKVNLALAVCSSRKGDFRTSTGYVLKVLELDKHNTTAKRLMKELSEFHDVKVPVTSGAIYKKIGMVIVVILTVSGAFIGGRALLNKTEDAVGNEVVVEQSVEEDVNEVEESPAESQDESANLENDTDETGETKSENLVDFDELEMNITNKEYDNIYDKLILLDESSLDGKQKTIYYNGNQLLKSEGVDYFYESGSEYYNNGQYEQARDEFGKGYKYSDGNYLRPHLIFFYACSSEMLGDIDSAINSYTEYYQNYKDDSYAAESVYKLVVLYKDRDIDESIKYAEIIQDEYSSSMYNNNIISDLLGGNNN